MIDKLCVHLYISLNRDLNPKVPTLSPTSFLNYDILCLLPHVFSFQNVRPLTVVLFKERMANIISKFLHKRIPMWKYNQSLETTRQ